MTETKVIVDGVELEVEVEIADDGKWLASVEGKTKLNYLTQVR